MNHLISPGVTGPTLEEFWPTANPKLGGYKLINYQYLFSTYFVPYTNTVLTSLNPLNNIHLTKVLSNPLIRLGNWGIEINSTYWRSKRYWMTGLGLILGSFFPVCALDQYNWTGSYVKWHFEKIYLAVICLMNKGRRDQKITATSQSTNSMPWVSPWGFIATCFQQKRAPEI